MKTGGFILKLLTFGLYNPVWRCNGCGKETFSGEFFCEDCLKTLPYIGKYRCRHCGRELKSPADFCSTCKGVLVSADRSRSVFNYESPVSGLIKKAKYDGGRYILDYFAKEISFMLLKDFGETEVLCFVPATEKRLKERGYNQSEILAQKVAAITGVPCADCLKKVKETGRQTLLNRSERLKNLSDAFRVSDKSAVRGKNVAIIDDVTTTGATGEAAAARLKKAGALRVFLLTVASVPPKCGY